MVFAPKPSEAAPLPRCPTQLPAGCSRLFKGAAGRNALSIVSRSISLRQKENAAERSHVGRSCRWISQSRRAGSRSSTGGARLSIQNMCSYFHRLMAEYRTITESSSFKHNTHTHTCAWPFLYIYLQNVLKFPVQHLTDEAQQILHASLALLFPLRCLDKC